MADMLNVQEFVYWIDYSISSKRKRHITGGVLISLAALFAGLAITTLTANGKEDEENEQI